MAKSQKNVKPTRNRTNIAKRLAMIKNNEQLLNQYNKIQNNK